MIRIGCWTSLVVMLGVHTAALEVVTPSLDMGVIADREYTVEWTGAGSGNFDIDLYYCGSYCLEDDCGDWVTALCPYGFDGCPDTAGDYDVVMPEPLFGLSGPGYKVRVADSSDETDFDCSDEFFLYKSDDVNTEMGGVTEPYLTITSPTGLDLAEAGEEYTILWEYDNGVGSSVDRFDIDLYLDDGGEGDCGTWLTSICDKEKGCKDSMGDYDVVIPEWVESGDYKIRVGRHNDAELFDCSESFKISGKNAGQDDDMSLSFEF
ncbi:unnamed protein product [Choristocarpus tenellus]